MSYSASLHHHQYHSTRRPSNHSPSTHIEAVPVVVVPDTPESVASGETLVKLVEASPKYLPAIVTNDVDDDGGIRSKGTRSTSPSPIRIPVRLPSNLSIKSDSPKSPSQEAKQIEVGEGAYLRSRLWWTGMVLIAVGEGGNFLSYGFAPASVVAPLGTVVSCSCLSLFL